MLAELLRRSIWLAAGSVFGRMLPLLVLMAASRQLAPADYATVSATFAWVAVATSLSTTGLATVLAQQLGPVSDAAARRAVLQPYLRRSVTAAAGLALLVALAGSEGAARLFGASVDSAAVLPAALAGGLWSQVSLAVAALNGSHRPRAAAATLAACGLLQGLPMAAGLALSASPLALAWSVAAGSAAGAALAVWQLRRCFGARPLAARSAAPDTPGVPAVPGTKAPAAPIPVGAVLWQTLAVAVVLPSGFFASAWVAHGADGTRQLALYFLLEQLHAVLTYGPSLLGQVLMPMVSRRTAAATARPGVDGDPVLRRIVGLALLAGAAGLLLAAAFGTVLQGLIARVHHAVLQPGDAWACRWMLASAALAACTSLLGGAMQGRGDLARAAQLNVGWCLVFLGGGWALSDHGTTGLQFARVAATLLLVAVTATVLLRQARPAPGAAA